MLSAVVVSAVMVVVMVECGLGRAVLVMRAVVVVCGGECADECCGGGGDGRVWCMVVVVLQP